MPPTITSNTALSIDQAPPELVQILAELLVASARRQEDPTPPDKPSDDTPSTATT